MVTHFELFENAGKARGDNRIIALKKSLNGVAMKNPLNGLNKERAVKFVYDQVGDTLKGVFRDDHWEAKRRLFELFGEIGLEWDLTRNSQYFNFPVPEGSYDSPRKEWYFSIYYISDKGKLSEISGTLVVSAIDVDFNSYDSWVLLNNIS